MEQKDIDELKYLRARLNDAVQALEQRIPDLAAAKRQLTIVLAAVGHVKAVYDELTRELEPPTPAA